MAGQRINAKGTLTPTNTSFVTATLFTAPSNRLARVFFGETWLSIRYGLAFGSGSGDFSIVMALRAGGNDLATWRVGATGVTAGSPINPGDIVTTSGGSTRANFLILPDSAASGGSNASGFEANSLNLSLVASGAFVGTTTLGVNGVVSREEATQPDGPVNTSVRVPVYLNAGETLELAAKHQYGGSGSSPTYTSVLRYVIRAVAQLDDNA